MNNYSPKLLASLDYLKRSFSLIYEVGNHSPHKDYSHFVEAYTQTLYSNEKEFYVISSPVKLYFRKERNQQFEVRLYSSQATYTRNLVSYTLGSSERIKLPKVDLLIETKEGNIFLSYNKDKKMHYFVEQKFIEQLNLFQFLTSPNSLVREYIKSKI